MLLGRQSTHNAAEESPDTAAHCSHEGRAAIMTVAALQESLGRAAAQVSPCTAGVPRAWPAHAAAGRARASCASW